MGNFRCILGGLATAGALLASGAGSAWAAPDCPGGQARPVSLAATGDVLESAAFDARGRFFYSDQSRGAVMEIDHFGQPARQIAAVTAPGAILPQSDGSLIVGSGDSPQDGAIGDAFPQASLLRVDPGTGTTSVVAAGLGMANGLAQASDGTIFATNDLGFDVDRVRGGQVDHGWARVISTNGAVVSADQRYLYVSQTFVPAAVQRITISRPGQVSQFAAAQGADVAAGPDDMSDDSHGDLYLAANGAGQVWRIAPDGSICVLASGLAFPSAVVLGPGTGTRDLYAVGFGGEIVELPGAVRS